MLGRVWAGCPRRGSPFSPPSGVCRLINLTNDPLNSNNLTNLPHTDTEASTADKIKKKELLKDRKKERQRIWSLGENGPCSENNGQIQLFRKQ